LIGNAVLRSLGRVILGPGGRKSLRSHPRPMSNILGSEHHPFTCERRDDSVRAGQELC
jgi:hypothetical protein